MINNGDHDKFQVNFADGLKEHKSNDISLQNWLMSRTIANRMRPYVFISYSHKDKNILEKIVAKFEKAGLPFWFDNRELLINSDKNYDKQIYEGIDHSFCFISFTSKNYWESKYCPYEFEIALKKRHAYSSWDEEFKFRQFHEHIIVVDLDNWNGSNTAKHDLLQQLNQPSIINYGRGNTDNFELTADEVVKDLLKNSLLEWMIYVNRTGDFSYVPEVPNFLSHLKKQSNLDDIISTKIYPELFPRIRILSNGDDENFDENTTMLAYLKDQRNKNNILIYGEGGGGKTILLKYFAKYLLDKKIPAVYVNVNNLRFEFKNSDPLIDYLQYKICGVEWWNVMQVYMQAIPNESNSVVLLIDGVNEIPINHRRQFIQNCINKFQYSNVHFILTSRFNFNDELSQEFQVIETIPPNNNIIDEHLRHRGVYVDENVRQLLRTPMLLTIFMDTERLKKNYFNIHLNENPCTCGQILENFVKLQIYDKNIQDGNIAENYVLFEYFLPEIALHAFKNDSMIVSSGVFWKCIYDIQKNIEKFEKYSQTRLIPMMRRIGTFSSNNAHEILPNIAIEKFNLLKPTDEFFIDSICDYEFTHQMWRDFFVACKIASEMTSIKQNDRYYYSSETEKFNSVLATTVFSEEILALVSDLTRENNRKPYQINPGEDWQFPSKTMSNEKFPSAEIILALWRNEIGKTAQTATYNLLNIMKLGRGGNLANLNLSNLDLRLCKMNGCKFSEFWCDKIYPSNFDNSFLNLSFFVNDGHSSKITALCTDNNNLIFSGDSSGNVRCFDTRSGDWLMHENFSAGDAVVCLAWNHMNEILAILYQNQLVLYTTKNSSTKKYFNKHRSKYYRYVRFSNETVEVSFNAEPLIFYVVDNEKIVPCKMEFDVPSRCAVWNPTSRQIVRSHLLRMIEVDYFDEQDQHWHRHQILQQKVQAKLEEWRDNASKTAKPIKLVEQEPVGYIKLEDFGVDKKDRGVDCIQFNSDGSKFLVAAGFSLLEFNSKTLEKINSRKFHAKIGACCYGQDGKIIVSVSNALNILDKDFVEENSFQGAKFSPIRFYLRSPNEKYYYVLSQNGELKQLDDEACVRRIRKISETAIFQWMRDKRTREYELMILPSKHFLEGRRFNFSTNLMQPLGWCYDTVDLMDEFIDTDDTVIYVIGEDRSEIMLVNKQLNTDERKIVQAGFSGVFIYGCSFRNLKGGSAKIHSNFFKLNGGEI